MEVGALSREARQHLYPSRYKMALAFSILPYPQPRGLTLRFAFPRQNNSPLGELRAYHVSCECQSGLGLASLPVARHLRQVS